MLRALAWIALLFLPVAGCSRWKPWEASPRSLWLGEATLPVALVVEKPDESANLETMARAFEATADRKVHFAIRERSSVPQLSDECLREATSRLDEKESARGPSRRRR